MSEDLRAAKIEPRNAIAGALSEPVKAASREILFKHVDESLLERIGFHSKLPEQQDQRTQEYLLMQITGYLEDMSRELADEKKAGHIRAIGEGVRNIQKGLALLANDSVIEGRAYRTRDESRARGEEENRRYFKGTGRSDAEVDDIIARAAESTRDTDRKVFTMMGYDKAIRNADFILTEAAEILTREWDLKRKTLTADNQDELLALARRDPDIMLYTQRAADAGRFDIMKYDIDATLDGYTDSLKAKMQALITIRDEVKATVTPALTGQSRA